MASAVTGAISQKYTDLAVLYPSGRPGILPRASPTDWLPFFTNPVSSTTAARKAAQISSSVWRSTSSTLSMTK
jgi:hypothetical protein